MNTSSMLAIFAFMIVFATGQNSCPFNEQECNCYGPKNGFVFWIAVCDSKDGQLPKFQASPESKYNITMGLYIEKADLRTIPANHFSAFDRVTLLSLSHHPTSPQEPREIHWDDKAFDGTRITSLITYSLDGLIPAPNALISVDLRSLAIFFGAAPISLNVASFKNIPKLADLTTFNTTIKQVSPDAFSQVENTLETLSLTQAQFSDLASLMAALKNAKKLELLNLQTNLIKEAKRDFFPDSSLSWLFLSNNPIANVPKDAFANLKNLHYLSLDVTDTITEFDLATISNTPTESIYVSLYRDSALKNIFASEIGQFPKTSTVIDVSYAGLETIDPKVKDIIEKFPSVILNIERNEHLKCDGLEWMSKIDCPDRILIDDSRCSDKQNQKLSDYLKSVDPDSKCLESEPASKVLKQFAKPTRRYEDK